MLFLFLDLINDFNSKTIATHTHQAIVFFPLCALPLFPLGIQRGFIKTAQRRGSQQQHTHKWQHPKRTKNTFMFLFIPNPEFFFLTKFYFLHRVFILRTKSSCLRQKCHNIIIRVCIRILNITML